MLTAPEPLSVAAETSAAVPSSLSLSVTAPGPELVSHVAAAMPTPLSLPAAGASAWAWPARCGRRLGRDRASGHRRPLRCRERDNTCAPPCRRGPRDPAGDACGCLPQRGATGSQNRARAKARRRLGAVVRLDVRRNLREEYGLTSSLSSEVSALPELSPDQSKDD